MTSADKQFARSILKQQAEAIARILEKQELPQDNERLTEIMTWAINVQSRNPRWSQERIARKTITYFKLKPKIQNDESPIDDHAGSADRRDPTPPGLRRGGPTF